MLFTELDQRQQLVQVTYCFTGERPTEEVLVEGRPETPKHATTVEHCFLGRVLLRRRVLWVPSNRKVGVRLDGEEMEILYRRPPFPTTIATPSAIRWNLGEQSRHVPASRSRRSSRPDARHARGSPVRCACPSASASYAATTTPGC